MIPLNIPEIKGNEWKYIKECLDTNWVSSVGSYVNKFENEFAKYLHANYSVVTMNGTAALELALRSLNIGSGDEVIVSALTFISPVNAIKYVGATPVFADVCRDTFVMDGDRIESLITDRTRAILPVHIYGHPADMDKIVELANKYNLFVIEDATESLGSLYKGKQTGTIGDIGCYSFNGNKLITTGAGGMLVTNNENYAKRAKFLSTQTKVTTENKAFYHPEIGYNFRMPNLLAAMGCAQLENIEDFIKIKIDNGNYYKELLKDVKGITLPVEKSWANNINWLFSIVVEDDYGINRDELIKILAENEVESRAFFMAVHKMPSYIEYKHDDMFVTEELEAKGLNLPSSVGLTKVEIETVCDIIKRYKGK